MVITVVAAEQDPLAQRAIVSYISRATDIRVLGISRDACGALKLITDLAPNILLTSIDLPDMSGLELTRSARALPSPPRILCFSAVCETAVVRESLAAGSAGFLAKADAPEYLPLGIRSVHAGDTPISPNLMHKLVPSLHHASVPRDLSDRDLHLIRMVGQGLGNAEIAHALGLTQSHLAVAPSNQRPRTLAAPAINLRGAARNDFRHTPASFRLGRRRKGESGLRFEPRLSAGSEAQSSSGQSWKLKIATLDQLSMCSGSC